MFYLTSIFCCCEYYALADNFRLHQSKSSNIDHPKTCKYNKKFLFFLCFSNEPDACERTPLGMPRLTKRAIAIKEYEALAERRVKKAFIHLCFDKEDSLEDDIDQF